MRLSLDRLPLRARLVAGFALAMVVVLAGAGAFVFWRVQVALDHRLDEDLASQAGDLRDAARSRPPGVALASLAAEGRNARLLAADGRVLAAGIGDRPDRELLTPAQVHAARSRRVAAGSGTLFSARGEHVRVLGVPVGAARPDRAAVAVAVVGLDQRDEALRELLVQLIVANLVALGLASLVGYRLARSALDPVERYRAQAERIAQGATDVRLAVPAGPSDEVSRLGTTLNAMLAAQERAAARQQQLVDDASHELRTPLGALAAEVELALGRPRSAEELRAALERIAADTARLSALTDELLTLGALGTEVEAEPVAARALLEEAAARAQAQLAGAPGRAVRVEAPADLTVSGDRALLGRALGNLVDNAVRHGAGAITLTAGADGTLRVHDEGALDPAFLPHAAERFRRDASSRTGPGTGLGLALVDAIAVAHGGQLRLCSGGVHHARPGPDAAVTTRACRHESRGTTVSLLLVANDRR